MGRPKKSLIRDRLVNILSILGEVHGYKLWKIYNSIYDNITSRVVYYHLDVGNDIDLFDVKKVKIKKGNYSWGKNSEIIVYKLSKNANPNPERSLKEYENEKK